MKTIIGSNKNQELVSRKNCSHLINFAFQSFFKNSVKSRYAEVNEVEARRLLLRPPLLADGGTVAHVVEVGT